MKKKYLGKTVGSLLIVLLMMPLGHALMILMEHFLEPTTLHYSAFLMGFVGLVITIAGVFVKGDTRQTCFGLAGALLFWTGWVEFLFAYFAQRFGVHCDLIGTALCRPSQNTSTALVSTILSQSTAHRSKISRVPNLRSCAVRVLNISSCPPRSACG